MAKKQTAPAAADPAEVKQLAEEFAYAMLMNPHVNQMLYGNPLQPHPCEDCASVGEYLAQRTYQLAQDYINARNQLAG